MRWKKVSPMPRRKLADVRDCTKVDANPFRPKEGPNASHGKRIAHKTA